MAVRYDPLAPEFQADPYPAYEWLREHDPVHHHVQEGLPSYWTLSRFDDVWDAVRRPELFSSAHGLTFYPDEIGRLGLAPTIVMMDPPEQTRLRALIGRGFTPRRVAELESSIRDFVRGRIEVLRGGAADLHRDFSSTIPTFVLASLLGVPEADRERFDPWVAALTALQDSGFDASALSAGDAVGEMFGYFSSLIEDRRTSPRDDLIGALTATDLTDGTSSASAS